MSEQPTSPFDAIRHMDEQENEWWSARELYKLLGYSTWQKFQHALSQAKRACQESAQPVEIHFNLEVKIVRAGATTKPREDYKLSRYACYLVILASDEAKPTVALGKVYFALQTRRQELADQIAALPEDQRRLLYRDELAILNQQLAEAAKKAGVIKPEHFATFADHGYRGLYGGETENAIHARKALQEREHISDFMGSDELAANAFRASLARQRLERDQVQKREEANHIHYQAGNKVRQTIEEFGGVLPEQLPTPEKSIQQLQRDEQKRLERGGQLELPFDEPGQLKEE